MNRFALKVIQNSRVVVAPSKFFSSRGTRRAPVVAKRRAPAAPAPAGALVPIEQAWTEVKDEASGQIYYWNTQTNETTALGAPRPTGPTALGPALPQEQQSGGVMSGIGGMVVQGMAFGVGSSIAHSVVGSMFGGGSSGGSDSGGGGDDSFDL